MPRTVLVTGANKGIGLAVARQLAREDDLQVIIGARNEALGEQAVAEIAAAEDTKLPPVFLKIDLNSQESIAAAAAQIKENHGKLHGLVSNAGYAAKGDAFDKKVASDTVGTNYFGTKNVAEAMFPLLEDGGRIVNVCSRAGLLSRIPSEDLRSKFASAKDSLTTSELDGLMNQFIESVGDGSYADKGWPKQTYGVSKVGLAALSRIHARENPHLSVFSICPGWVKTDMAGPKAPKTPDEGADVIVWALTGAPADKSGAFFAERKEIDY